MPEIWQNVLWEDLDKWVEVGFYFLHKWGHQIGMFKTQISMAIA